MNTHAIVRAGLAVLLLCASTFVTGCGQRDPVQVELLEYQRVIVTPTNADEERFSAELAQADQAHPGGDLPAQALLELFRDRLAPIYREVLARVKAHRPRSPQVLAVHNDLVSYYEVGLADLNRCVTALSAADERALAEVQQAMISRDADGLAGRLERLYAKHKLAIE